MLCISNTNFPLDQEHTNILSMLTLMWLSLVVLDNAMMIQARKYFNPPNFSHRK